MEGEGPVLDPVRSLEDIKKLNPDGIADYLTPVFEILNRLSREIPEETALIGFAGSPWTIAVYMVEGRGGTDHGKVLGWAENDPEDFQALIDMLVDATSARAGVPRCLAKPGIRCSTVSTTPKPP